MHPPDDATADGPDSEGRASTSDPDSGSRRSLPGCLRLIRPRLLLLVAVALTLIALIGFFVVIPFPWTLRSRNPDMTSLMKQRVEQARADGRDLTIRQEWVSLNDVSPALIRAVIAAEDDRFREHAGVDWLALANEVKWTGDDSFSWWSGEDRAALREAIAYVRANRDDIRGRSTITQQLAKNLYFGLDRSMVRKAMEVVVAGRLERRLGKDRIMEIYLNIVELGPGIFGVEAASQEYFGRSASSLTLFQAASLAASLPHPLTSNPAHRPSRMAWRRDLILRRLSAAPGSPPIPIPPPLIDAFELDDSISVGVLDSAGLPLDSVLLPDSSGVHLRGLGVDTLTIDTIAADTVRPHPATTPWSTSSSSS